MNLNWSTMKKEHKQAVLLIGMWVAGGLFALYQFVLMPFFRDRGQSVGELEELQTQILKAQVAMDGESKLRSEFAQITRDVQFTMDNYIVPVENPLSWVTEKVYLSARQVGADIQSVAEVGSTSPHWDKATKTERLFKPYIVRIITESSYTKIIALVGELEKSNPYLCISGIYITSQDQAATRHMVNIVVEWPLWGRKIQLETEKMAKVKPKP